jgi:hypothetical protein
VSADETPLERLGRLAGELSIEAIRADVTGAEAVTVGHEWANDLVSTVAKVRAAHAKPTPREAWSRMAPMGQLVSGAACIALASVFLGVAWVVVAWAWETVGAIAA